MANSNTPDARPLCMTPSFPDSPIWPYEVTLADERTVKVHASSPDAAKRKVVKAELVGKRKGYRVQVAKVTTLVVTSEQMHRILD